MKITAHTNVASPRNAAEPVHLGAQYLPIKQNNGIKLAE